TFRPSFSACSFALSAALPWERSGIAKTSERTSAKPAKYFIGVRLDHTCAMGVSYYCSAAMTSSESPLVVRNLRKEYRIPGGAPLCAVDGISFEIHRGECFGLLGPNGAGKSTSMNCITGFYPATEGEIRLMGYDVFREPRKARQSLGVCSQEDTRDSGFTVLGQMMRFGTYFGLKVERVRAGA